MALLLKLRSFLTSRNPSAYRRMVGGRRHVHRLLSIRRAPCLHATFWPSLRILGHDLLAHHSSSCWSSNYRTWIATGRRRSKSCGPSSRASLNQAVQAKTVQREGAVRAADLERTRIERDLHDGVQPRLVSVAISLGMAQKKIDSDPKAAKELVAEAHVSIKAAITELRQLARGIHPSVLDDRGLDAALSALAGRSHIPVTMDVRMEERENLIADEEISAGFRDAEAAVYFAIAESLTNAAKHSRAGECRVVVRLRDVNSPIPVLWARVEDNGVGGAEIIPGGGLDGICNRVLAAGGTSSFVSPIGGPTALEVSVPCAS